MVVSSKSRAYTSEEKASATSRAMEIGYAAASVELGIPSGTLSCWVFKARQAADKALVAARALLDQGWSWRAVAEATGVQKDTLRRRLAEAELVAQKSAGGEGG